MDGSQFDDLSKRLSTTRLTRLTALRSLAAGGLAAFTGVGLTRQEAGAKKNNNEKKKRVCNCTSADPASCVSQKKKKKAVTKLLRSNPCAYRGRCTGVSGCAATVPLVPLSPPPPGSPPVPGFTCTAGTETGCTGGQVCNAAGNACVACTSFTQCTGERICIDGVCVGNEVCGGKGGFKCPEPLFCADIGGSNIDRCQLSTTCGGPGDPACPTGEFCRLGFCVAACAPTATDPIGCGATGRPCVGGLCLFNF